MMNPIEYDVIDQMAVSLAREIKDKELCYTGIAIPLAVVAIQLARMIHAPNLDFFYGGYLIAPDLEVDLFTIMTDLDAFEKAIPKAKGFSQLKQLYHYWGGSKRTLDFGIIRPAQIDQWGNVNNSVVGQYEKPKFRFPGGAAIADIINACHRVLAYIPRHDKRTFVDNVDFITGKGASPTWRKELGFDMFKGITVIVTDLAILDFQTTDGRMRVRSIHENSSKKELQENTGFTLEIPDPFPVTKPPTSHEMQVLRETADPLEVRKFDYRQRK